MVGGPEVLVVEADGGFAEAVVFLQIAVCGLLPLSGQETCGGEMRFLSTDVGSFEGTDGDNADDALHDGEQQEDESDDA